VAFDAVVEAVAAGAFGSVAACQMTSSSASNASEHSAALLLNVNRRIAVIQFSCVQARLMAKPLR
jgi:hypothetical protein